MLTLTSLVVASIKWADAANTGVRLQPLAGLMEAWA